jgi:hypothetical protein
VGSGSPSKNIVAPAMARSHEQDDLKRFITSKHVFKRRLTDDAIFLIYNSKEEGNKAAHESNMDLILDAVLNGGRAHIEKLVNIFQCLYDIDIGVALV